MIGKQENVIGYVRLYKNYSYIIFRSEANSFPPRILAPVKRSPRTFVRHTPIRCSGKPENRDRHSSRDLKFKPTYTSIASYSFAPRPYRM